MKCPKCQFENPEGMKDFQIFDDYLFYAVCEL
jgi:hypothetical protein